MSGLVAQVRERFEGLWIKFQQHRTQPRLRLMQSPDRFLMLPSERFQRTGLLAQPGQLPVNMPVRSKDASEHERVAGIRLTAGLRVSFTVAGARSWVDRVHRDARGLQTYDDEVLVRLDRYWH